MAARRALVIGGSLGGLFAAHLLRRAGWDALVFERNPESHGPRRRAEHASAAHRCIAARRGRFRRVDGG
ncbi:MAG: hypothetical protein E6G80_14660 [Alphaproteobacteria bacterium]|nr:MAG: hypothetical protein E6G80_14660 [Alphaproteobacteria bacterium]